MRTSILVCLVALLAGGCTDKETTLRPDPVALTADAAGHYCQMTVIDHPGPKAQVHLAGNANPLWFTQVRDAFAFERTPEDAGEIAAIYVSDMGAASSWEDPGADNWIAAETAYFVVGSKRRGGMGAPELVPFADRDAAAAFTRQFGGNVIGFADINDAMVVGPVDIEPEPPEATPHGGLDQPEGTEG